MPSPRMPASPREAPRIVHSRSLPFASRSVGAQAARSRDPGSAGCREAVSQREARQAAHLLLGGGLQAQRDCPGGWSRALPLSASPSCVSGSSLPAQARGQPADEQHRGDRRVGVVADGDALDRLQLGAQPRRVEGGGDPLAPRGGAQPGEIDDVDARRSARRRGRCASCQAGSSTESSSTAWASGEQRLDRLGVAVGGPQQRGQVAHDERVGDREQVVEMAIADLDDHGLAQQRELAGPGSPSEAMLTCASRRSRLGS